MDGRVVRRFVCDGCGVNIRGGDDLEGEPHRVLRPVQPDEPGLTPLQEKYAARGAFLRSKYCGTLRRVGSRRGAIRAERRPAARRGSTMENRPPEGE